MATWFGPRHGNRGPAGRSETSSCSLADADDVTAELRHILSADRPTYEAGWADGYRAGYFAGWDVGHAGAGQEMADQWAAAVRVNRRVTRPEPPSEAWRWLLAWRQRHGEYAGGPVDFDTGDLLGGGRGD